MQLGSVGVLSCLPTCKGACVCACEQERESVRNSKKRPTGVGLFAHQLIVICSIPTNCSNLSVLFLFAFCVRVSTCAHVSVHMHTVSRWLCVRGQSRGTVPLHLRDSFNLLGPLTGNTTHKHALTITQRHTHTHARTHARAPEYSFVYKCIFPHEPIFCSHFQIPT